MMIRNIAIPLMLQFLGGVIFAQDVFSPSENIQVSLGLNEGQLTYQIFLNGQKAIEPSPLGLDTSIGSFSRELEAIDSEVSPVADDYVLPHGKVSQVHYRANEMVARYRNKNGDSLEVIFRVSDRDVAFRYRISSEKARRVTIKREITGFDFPSEATAFVTPQVPWGGGFAGTKPSYEEGYLIDVPVGTPSGTGLGFTFPALFRLGSRAWALVSETGVTSHYAGCRLSDPTLEGLYRIAFPEQSENAGIGESEVSASLPATTPWRTLTLGDTLAPIVETTVATDVVEPLYDASTIYRPGKATWSWILWQDPSMNLDDQTTFIDLAAEMHYEYILIDAFWDQNIGREEMPKLVDYARSKGVDVLLWYNSNGYWNDAFQTPINCLDTAPARHREMAWLQSIGVKGMKVDFFGGDKQVTMKLYEDILTDANRYGLSLNFHGATLPRGWERMYPNHMTSEAVTASENLVFSQGFADGEAYNSTIFPFIRNTVAAMDYGPVFLNNRFARNSDQGNFRRTTDAFQLATAVLFQSPIQHFGITPNNLQEQPGYVIDFLKQVPTVWDEIRYVDGYPGKSVVLARRSGDRWYIAATHSSATRQEIRIQLPWLKGQSFDLFYDKSDRSVGKDEVTLDSSGNIVLTLEPYGGAVLVSCP